MKRANITNGANFNRYFEDTFFEPGIPFNEAMMVGNSSSKLFSEEFCLKRAGELHTPIEEYNRNMSGFLQLMKNLNEVEEVVLWFGADTFCQLNLLTVLTYLEQINYAGRIFTVTIDDESFEVLREKSQVTLGEYRKLYDSTILQKVQPPCGDSVMCRAFALYFDYLSDDGSLARMVKDNPGLPVKALAVKLLNASREYGISDLMAYALIEKYAQK